ncbi:hypothetical protein WDW86_20450 [Bdellovibrionota bacterium FG-2]
MEASQSCEEGDRVDSMKMEFNYHSLIEEIRKEGFPTEFGAKRKKFLELDNWMEAVFSLSERRAAGFVGHHLFGAGDTLIALYFAYELLKRNRSAFLEFKGLVDREFQTGELEALYRRRVDAKAEETKLASAADKEERARNIKTFTYQEFYDLVWSTPARTLSPDLGISDVMIAKICKKHNIPKPYKGYWTKYYAGQKPKQRQLPQVAKMSEGKIVILRKSAK